jgi:lipoate-protein ligase A
MKKISTLFKKDPSNLALIINEIDPQNQWVFDGYAIATRKFDGSAAAIINGKLYKRYDAKKGKKAPEGSIPCQEADSITGHHPHWVECDNSKPEDKFFVEAYDNLIDKQDGTYELCGEKVQGNAEKIQGHRLIKHGSEVLELKSFDFNSFKEYLSDPSNDIEGIVFHHNYDDRMCKLRKSDFGIRR